MARGYIYEVVSDKDAVNCMSEGDFYDRAGHDFDYCRDVEPEFAQELASDFIGSLKSDGAQGDGNEIIFTRDAKCAYFGNRLDELKAKIAEMTAEDFATNCYELKTLIDDEYADVVCFDYCFYTMDDFIRNVEIGKPYYVGENVVFMH